jgi:hypothetical protein
MSWAKSLYDCWKLNSWFQRACLEVGSISCTPVGSQSKKLMRGIKEIYFGRASSRYPHARLKANYSAMASASENRE